MLFRSKNRCGPDAKHSTHPEGERPAPERLAVGRGIQGSKKAPRYNEARYAKKQVDAGRGTKKQVESVYVMVAPRQHISDVFNNGEQDSKRTKGFDIVNAAMGVLDHVAVRRVNGRVEFPRFYPIHSARCPICRPGSAPLLGRIATARSWQESVSLRRASRLSRVHSSILSRSPGAVRLRDVLVAIRDKNCGKLAASNCMGTTWKRSWP